MTPIEDLLTASQRLSFDGTEYRSFFPAGWREKIFWDKKKAQPSNFGDLRLWCVGWSAFPRLY